MKPNDPTVLSQCNKILDEAGIQTDRQLAAEMMQTIIRMAADEPGRADMKLMLRALKELRYGFKTFKPFRGTRKISVFGSARTPPESPDYKAAAIFAKEAAAAGFMVITGAGGGIMQAGHEGAGLAQSFGVAIRLPFEQQTNPVIAGDEKLIHFRYFFTRKLMFAKETHGIALFPGGFGTHDEGFEVLTLLQTGRCDPMPVVMCERRGGDYWKSWDRFIRRNLMDAGLISLNDPALYFITDDPHEAALHISRFYRNYHSLRYVEDDLVLRLQHAPTMAELDSLRVDFSDIVTEGTLEIRPAQIAEPHAAILPESPRLVLKFDRRSLARLRQLIDRLNRLPSLPPIEVAQPQAAEVGSTEPDRGVSTIAEEESIKLNYPKQESAKSV